MKENKKQTANDNKKPTPKKVEEKKPPKVYADIFEEAFDKLGEPKNDLEKDTLEYVKPFVSEMIAQDIVGKGLTLSGCLQHCFNNGRKFETKIGCGSFAKISEEQHFAWVREYFGIEGVPVSPKEPAKSESANTKLDLDLDSLFD